MCFSIAMPLVTRGRLSVQRVSQECWRVIQMMSEKGGWEEMTFGKKKTPSTSKRPRQAATKNSRAKTKPANNNGGSDVEAKVDASEEPNVKPRKGKKRKATDIDVGPQEVPNRRSVRTKKEDWQMTPRLCCTCHSCHHSQYSHPVHHRSGAGTARYSSPWSILLICQCALVSEAPFTPSISVIYMTIPTISCPYSGMGDECHRSWWSDLGIWMRMMRSSTTALPWSAVFAASNVMDSSRHLLRKQRMHDIQKCYSRITTLPNYKLPYARELEELVYIDAYMLEHTRWPLSGAAWFQIITGMRTRLGAGSDMYTVREHEFEGHGQVKYMLLKKAWQGIRCIDLRILCSMALNSKPVTTITLMHSNASD